jgi:hypothetical protein
MRVLIHITSRHRTLEDLLRYRDEIYQQWQQNQRDYAARYGNSLATYAAALNDDFNGEGEEFAHLMSLLQHLDEELKRRWKETTTESKTQLCPGSNVS